MSDKHTTGRWRTILDLFATVAIIAACAVLVMVALGNRRAVKGSQPPPLPEDPIALDGAPVLGSWRAPVAIVEYADFQCPHCGTFARETLPRIVEKYVDRQLVLVAFRHLPLRAIHPLAMSAAKAADCAARSGRFWQMHHGLFDRQNDLDGPGLASAAHAAGLDASALQRCLDQETTDAVRRDLAGASALKVTGAPTFFIGALQPDRRVKVLRRVSGALSFGTFAKLLDDMLAGTSPSDDTPY